MPWHSSSGAAEPGSRAVLVGRMRSRRRSGSSRPRAARDWRYLPTSPDEHRSSTWSTTVLREFGSVDVLFNNAGSFVALGGIWEVDPDRWWQDVTVNLLGVMLCCQAVLPHMMASNEGIIINMMGGDQIPGWHGLQLLQGGRKPPDGADGQGAADGGDVRPRGRHGARVRAHRDDRLPDHQPRGTEVAPLQPGKPSRTATPWRRSAVRRPLWS